MAAKTFVEKIFNANCGDIVFQRPDIVLTHDNTASIHKTFQKMGGDRILNPEQLLVVLDHNAPPTTAKLASQYQEIRDMVNAQGIEKFYDAGRGICHQIMSYHAKPAQLIVGSDSHTCTAGAFNAMAAGIDRTEAAGLWKRGETWFRVPESIKITLVGSFNKGVFAKDLSLYIIGKLGSDGANYMSIEYHGEGVSNLSIPERMTIANLASEMGAKNAVFPADENLAEFYDKETLEGVWADDGAVYAKELTVDLNELVPLVAVPHHVDNIKAISEVEGLEVHEGLIGTCTNGRLEDLLDAAIILKGKKVKKDFQLLITPASREIYKSALKDGLIEIFVDAGANILSPSCGPCLGTGQGIPADGYNVISTANRNFKGRMGNPKSNVYLASPTAVAMAAIEGKIVDPRGSSHNDVFESSKEQSHTTSIEEGENRKIDGVWNYSDVDNLNTDLMFAGNLTYSVLSSDAASIMPHLFKGFDDQFSDNVGEGDVIFAGDNFGCGSSREHPAVGLAHAGVKAVIVKSINRIFYRSSVNQGLPIIVLPDAVDAYKQGDKVEVSLEMGWIKINDKEYKFGALPEKLMGVFKAKGLVNYIAQLG